MQYASKERNTCTIRLTQSVGYCRPGSSRSPTAARWHHIDVADFYKEVAA